MNEQEQRIAIAEFCGWSQFREEVCKTITYLWGFDGSDMDIVPDYLNDLNAMHEAVGKLLFSQRKQYREELQTIMSPCGSRIHISECIDATAKQRAEALLKTIGKWTE